MKRDQREFESWWTLNALGSSTVYHTGLDFEYQVGEIILIDEADELILSNPTKFSTKFSNNHCICLTATPDNADKDGVEREVISFLGFKIFNGTPDFVNTVPGMGICKTIDFDSCSDELVWFIQEQLKDCAVLLYCSLEF